MEDLMEDLMEDFDSPIEYVLLWNSIGRSSAVLPAEKAGDYQPCPAEKRLHITAGPRWEIGQLNRFSQLEKMRTTAS
jgi:hypothetical protein